MQHSQMERQLKICRDDETQLPRLFVQWFSSETIADAYKGRKTVLAIKTEDRIIDKEMLGGTQWITQHL